MVKRAVEMQGTVTVWPVLQCLNRIVFDLLTRHFQGEHGVGLVKRDYLAHELGESTVDAMRKVCQQTGSEFFVLAKLTTD
jgi:D-lactate dehydrogenase (cytochrome)